MRVVAGTGRFLDALPQFRFDEADLEPFRDFLDSETLAYLLDYRFAGDVDGSTNSCVSPSVRSCSPSSGRSLNVPR